MQSDSVVVGGEVNGEVMYKSVDPTDVVVNREMTVKFEDVDCRYRPELLKTNICINFKGDISNGIFSHVSEKQPREKITENCLDMATVNAVTLSTQI